MKKYAVTEGAVETEAQARGVNVDALKEAEDGPDPTDTADVAEQPVKFDPSTTAWNVPSGDGFLCEFYSGDTNPLRTSLPMSAESLDEFADE
jgi:hypothetical protein